VTGSLVRAGFDVVQTTDMVVRKEEQLDVPGLLVVARAAGSSPS
jgi:predicted TPR repeat methyltransferase